jgi:hypothetical protein
MTRYYLLAILLFVSTVSFSQKFKSFSGLLEYKITAVDTSLANLYPETRMVIYTNDTIVRMENQTSSLGSQVTIRHTEKQKAYQLLETEFGKFAIKADLTENSDSIPASDRYSFEKKCKRAKILEKKAKLYEVKNDAYKSSKNFFFYKNYSNKYLNTFDEIPYLPVVYYVTTYDVILKYELVRMSEYTPNRDLFGIPADYERVTFDEFLDKYLEFKGQNNNQE